MELDVKDLPEIIKLKAVVCGLGERTIRLELEKGTAPLCTLAYSKSMSEDLRRVLAHRIAGLWNDAARSVSEKTVGK